MLKAFNIIFSMIPESEPILLDLEKLFLLSDSLENQIYNKKPKF